MLGRCVSRRKAGTEVGGWVFPKGANSTTVSGSQALVGTGSFSLPMHDWA